MVIKNNKIVKSTVAAVLHLRTRLQSGAYERCACCLNWFTGSGSVCVHIPLDGSTPTPYCLCQRCSNKATSSEQAKDAVIEKAHAYLRGGAA